MLFLINLFFFFSEYILIIHMIGHYQANVLEKLEGMCVLNLELFMLWKIYSCLVHFFTHIKPLHSSPHLHIYLLLTLISSLNLISYQQHQPP